MRAVAVFAALFFLATSLSAQGPTAGAQPATANSTPKQMKHLGKVKKQALRFADWDRVCVHLADRSQVEGQVVNITNEGIQIGIWTFKPGSRTTTASPRDHSSRFIPFAQIQSIRFAGSEHSVALAYGVELGLLGPLGWWAEWLLATGRAQD